MTLEFTTATFSGEALDQCPDCINVEPGDTLCDWCDSPARLSVRQPMTDGTMWHDHACVEHAHHYFGTGE